MCTSVLRPLAEFGRDDDVTVAPERARRALAVAADAVVTKYFDQTRIQEMVHGMSP